MRWDELFSDLEAEASGLEQRERDVEIAERTRMELARIDAGARLAAGIGLELGVRIEVVGPVRGRLERVTSRWLLLEAGPVQWVVALDAVLGVRGLPVRAVTGQGDAASARLGWGSAWRVLARDRSVLHVVRRDGSSLDVVAERVGADFVELAVQAPGVRLRELVPFAAVVGVRLAADPG